MTLVPLWLPKLVAPVLAAFFVFGTEASRTLKVGVVLAVAGSFFLPPTLGLLLQVAISVFVLIFFKVGN